MNKIGARLSRRAVLGGAIGGLALAALGPRISLGAPDGGDPRALAFDGRALVLARNGLWRSGDGGTSWMQLPVPGAEITALAARSADEGRIFAGLGSGKVMVSHDGGISWSDAGRDLPGASVRALAVAAHEPDRLYAAVEGDGLWTSADAGESWEFAMDRPYQDGAERDLLTLASVNLETGMGGFWIYAGTASGLTRLPDCFCRWQEVQPGNAMDALVSGDAPPPEKPLPAGEAVLSLAVSPQEPTLLYAGLPSGIWKSADAGVSWAKVSDPETRQLAVDPGDPLHVVAVTGAGILTSRDGGLTWTAPSARDGERP